MIHYTNSVFSLIFLAFSQHGVNSSNGSNFLNGENKKRSCNNSLNEYKNGVNNNRSQNNINFSQSNNNAMPNANQVNFVGKVLFGSKNDPQINAFLQKQLKRPNNEQSNRSNKSDYEESVYKRTRSISSLSSNSTILKADPESETESENPDVVGEDNDREKFKKENNLFKNNNENSNDDHNNNHGDGEQKESFWRPY